MKKIKTFEQKVRCECGYEEEHTVESGSSMEGLKCPNCDEPMSAEDEEE